MLDRQRIDYKIETKVWWDEVSEKVRVPVPKPSCGCYSTSCGCSGKSDCGCSAPKCGCAPPQIEYAFQTVVKKVPMAEEVRIPVMVPYQEAVTVMVDEQIMHMVEVTKMVPKIVLETLEEIVPCYKEVEVETSVPVVITECKQVL